MGKYKGRVLVINAFDFESKDYSDRWDSIKDNDNLKTLFMNLGFQVVLRILSYSKVRAQFPVIKSAILTNA
mgnify:CR=1 FL=1